MVQQYMTVKEAAELLRVCQATIYNLMGAGKLASFKVGHRRLIKTESIAAMTGDRP